MDTNIENNRITPIKDFKVNLSISKLHNGMIENLKKLEFDNDLEPEILEMIGDISRSIANDNC